MNDSETLSRRNLNEGYFSLIDSDDPKILLEWLEKQLPSKRKRMNISQLLHVCAQRNARNLTEFLIGEFDCDPWTRDNWGNLAIDHALAKGNFEIYEILDSAMYPKEWFLRE